MGGGVGRDCCSRNGAEWVMSLLNEWPDLRGDRGAKSQGEGGDGWPNAHLADGGLRAVLPLCDEAQRRCAGEAHISGSSGRPCERLPLGRASPALMACRRLPAPRVQDFETLKRGFVSRGKRKINMWLKARAKIAEFGHHFVQDGMVSGISPHSFPLLSCLPRGVSRGSPSPKS